MLCQECTREASWLAVTQGQAWIDRYCSAHLQTNVTDPEVEIYARSNFK